ncbi:Bax inhibitor-1/YccA family protein [Pseudomonas taiwanensis]|uniref:Bax inhibitor-1/YccA family protein n=1 Tax=Pseudomonas taiwanensis TaxID=470150 RepID=UPI0028DD8767|nr:Bax inhibitor-1/YccA family protein [Pseudomonas taiwanensis]MDT8925467.1 Bax inhibitor-1/YccA family protein [Pseudomonas taiwanensis]
MSTNSSTITSVAGSATSRVLRQTYMLLSMTLVVSGITALLSQSLHLPGPGLIVTLLAFYGIMFAIHKYQNGVGGIAWTFGLAAFMGYAIGPMLNHYLAMKNGGDLVANAMLLTAFTFCGLSAYVLKTGRDMKFLEGFLMAGFFVLMGAVILSLFFPMSGLQLAISAGFVLFSSAAILYETSQILRGGQTNYVLATVSLFVSIFNLFTTLLSLLGMGSKD